MCVISIPAVKDRYYSVMLTDSHTYNYAAHLVWAAVPPAILG